MERARIDRACRAYGTQAAAIAAGRARHCRLDIVAEGKRRGPLTARLPALAKAHGEVWLVPCDDGTWIIVTPIGGPK